MAPRRGKRPSRGESLYPSFALYSVRVLQLLAAGTVAAVMFYFLSQRDQYQFRLPWVFYFLQGAALTTLITTALLGIWTWCVRRGQASPVASGASSLFNFLLWAAAFGLVADAMKYTLTRPCTVAYWADGQGVMICSLHKTLFTGAAVGTLTTLAILVLDFFAWKKRRSFGRDVTEKESLLPGRVGGPSSVVAAGGAGDAAAVGASTGLISGQQQQYMPVWAQETGYGAGKSRAAAGPHDERYERSRLAPTMEQDEEGERSEREM